MIQLSVPGVSRVTCFDSIGVHRNADSLWHLVGMNEGGIDFTSTASLPCSRISSDQIKPYSALLYLWTPGRVVGTEEATPQDGGYLAHGSRLSPEIQIR